MSDRDSTVRAARAEAVTEAGATAPWLVMVHGMSQDRRVFSAQVAAFRDRFRLLLVDLPGHGLSADIPGPYGIAEFAGSVLAALDAAGLGQAHYWGTHTGSAIGLLLASRDPGRFRSLVLEGAVMPGRTMPVVARELERIGGIARARGVATARERWFQEPDWFKVMRDSPGPCRAEAHRAIVADFAGGPWLDDAPAAPVADLTGRLGGITVPALVYNGEHDLADFVEVADILEQRLPQVRRAVVPGGGGFPFWEYPDQVNEMVGAFLDAH
jgi:3-oxoadipate enol-lactonase